MDGLLRDLRQALRALARAPGYTAVTVAVLGVALGATTAIFGAVHGVLLKRLPYRDPERLAFVWERSPVYGEVSVAHPNFRDWRERQRSFEDLAAVRLDAASVSGRGAPERVKVLQLSAGALKVLGVEPLLGRELAPEEDRRGGPRAVLVTHAYWRSRLGGTPAALGSTLIVDGAPHTLVGILPPGFEALYRPFDVVQAIGQLPPELVDDRGNHPGIYVLGRLRPGTSFAQAGQDLEAIGLALRQEHPMENADTLPAIVPLRDRLVRDARPMLLLLMAAGAFVLLVGVANAANLALARGLARTRELAIRAAVGAGRAQLVRQTLAEGAVLGLGGGVLGLVLAVWAIDLLAAARPVSVPAGAIGLAPAVFAFGAAAALLAGLAASAAPALALSEPRLHDVLKATDRGGAGHGGRVRAALVVAEVALACVLVAGAGLSLRALLRLQAADPGFRTADVLTFALSAPRARYDTAAKVRAFHRDVLAALRAAPGVRGAALSWTLPLAGVSDLSFGVAGLPPFRPEDRPYAVSFSATPGLAEALGVTLLEGRLLDERDRPGAPRAVVVDDVLARKFFPGRSAVGERLTSDDGQRRSEIVGVVRHVKAYGMAGREPAPYQTWWALGQHTDDIVAVFARDVSGVVRVSGPPLRAVEAVRRAVASVDPDVPVYDVRGMDEVVRASLSSERFAVALLVGFGAIAVLLAAAGLYAVMAQAVARRTHEIGIRMALGAQPDAVGRMVVAQALRLVAGGVALGLAGAAALSRAFASVVPEAGGLDPLALALAAAGLVAVAALATWIPARRATRVDPMVALREA